MSEARRVLILTNAVAGRGRAAELAAQARTTLASAGHEAQVADARSLNGTLGAALAGVDALAIAGGDGTVLHALDAAVASGTPIYHMGTGNENLLARQFGHAASPARLARAIAAWEVQTVDLGRCAPSEHAAEGVWFATMLSVGPDASIVHRLAARRTGTVWHGSYVAPTLAELRQPSLPPMRIVADGEAIADGVRGMVIVANTRQYAVRLDPAHRADPADGLLDVIVLPARSSVGLALRLLRSRARRHGPGVIHARARRVEIESLAGPAAVQLDGEAPGVRPGGGERGLRTPVRVEVRPAALRVLRG